MTGLFPNHSCFFSRFPVPDLFPNHFPSPFSHTFSFPYDLFPNRICPAKFFALKISFFGWVVSPQLILVILDVRGLFWPCGALHPTEVSPSGETSNQHFYLKADWDQAVDWPDKCPSLTVHDLNFSDSSIRAWDGSDDPHLFPLASFCSVIRYDSEVSNFEIGRSVQPLRSWYELRHNLLLKPSPEMLLDLDLLL